MDTVKKMNDHLHQISTETVGKAAVAIGGGGTLIQTVTEWTNMFVLFGNAALVAGGLYMMFLKLFDQRRNRRKGD